MPKRAAAKRDFAVPFLRVDPFSGASEMCKNIEPQFRTQQENIYLDGGDQIILAVAVGRSKSGWPAKRPKHFGWGRTKYSRLFWTGGQFTVANCIGFNGGAIFNGADIIHP